MAPPRESVERPAIRAPRADGERVRRLLLEAGALDTTLRPLVDGDTLLLPLTSADAAPSGMLVTAAAFEPAKPSAPSWQDVAARSLPPDVVALLPTAFDQLGHVVVLKLPPEVEPYAGVVGAAILDAIKSARTVALDGGVKGELRVRSLTVIAGDEETRTEHAEFGVRLLVDPAQAYFSPRLATERKRVTDLVADGEHVVDLTAGVGPFAVLIAKHAKPKRVDAVDLNPRAVALCAENVRRNGVADVVHPHYADARDWADDHRGVADRVITNLPHGAAELLEAAVAVLKPGGVWHYHCAATPEALPGHIDWLNARAAKAGFGLTVQGTREVRTYAPREPHYAVDFAVTRLADSPGGPRKD